MEPIIEAYFDGACMPTNPSGAMGMGMYIRRGNNSQEWQEGRAPAYENSNNVAEYLAFIEILRLLKFETKCIIRIYGDSLLVVNQMNDKWEIRKGYYKENAILAKSLLKELRRNNVVTVTWIPRDSNALANDLAQLAAGKKLPITNEL